jgi:peptide chain release factor 2
VALSRLVFLHVATVDVAEELKELDQTLSSIEAVLDLDTMRRDLADLNEQVAVPDLWDDQEHAQQVTSRLSHLQGELNRVESLRRRLDDLSVLFELAEDESDADTLAEAEAELTSIRKILGELEVRTLLSGEYDQREALVTIRAEAGGVDAADFAEMLMRMYLRWAERHNYPAEVLDTSYAEEAGLKSVTFQVNVPYAYGTLSVEQGTHRLVRISPFDNQGRRQTSFAGVEVLPVTEVTDHIDIPENDIRIDVFRSSGPGGQSVNTTDSAVRITHLPTGLVVAIQDEKSQHKNKAKAMAVLRARLLEMEQSKAHEAEAAVRRSMVGSGDRSEKIRTYNFPDGRVTDHRIKHTSHQLANVLGGGDELDGFTERLNAAERSAQLAESDEERRAKPGAAEELPAKG